jgi:hypothetical protein
MSNTEIKSFKKGVSLYIAVTVMAVLLAIGLGLSTIITIQMKMVRETGESVVAFYAADTGIERAMYKLYKEGVSPPFQFTLNGYLDLNGNGLQDSGEPTYQVIGTSPGESCSADYFCLKSTGIYKEVNRAIEASY